jgi:hypothetical protein
VGKPSTRFCIVTMGRTGSTFLRSLLDAVPNVACLGEIFHGERPYVQSFDPAPELDVTAEERDRDPLAYLSQLEQLTFKRLPNRTLFGFKLFIVHNATVLHHVIAEPTCRLVVLGRRNALAQYSSTRVAQETGVWSPRAGAQVPDANVRFDENDFVAFADRMSSLYEEVFELLRARDEPYFSLDYLDVKDESVLRSLFDFLGVEFTGSLHELVAGVRLGKLNTSHIAERFVNSGDVVTAMKRLSKEQWLVER